jgi:asparagine synthase (glutamine-hydrolysing)
MLAGSGDRNRKMADLAEDRGSLVHPYFLARMLFRNSERRALFSRLDHDEAQQTLDKILQASVEDSKPLDPVNRVSYLESKFYMRNTLLRDSDFMSMAHGLEVRVPFLDRALVEACFHIPGRLKTRGDLPKGLLLANLGTDLPREIVNRPKRGFTLPFERWLRGEMKPVMEDALLKGDWEQTPVAASAVRQVWNRFLAGETSWSRPWALFILKRWCEQNL